MKSRYKKAFTDWLDDITFFMRLAKEEEYHLKQPPKGVELPKDCVWLSTSKMCKSARLGNITPMAMAQVGLLQRFDLPTIRYATIPGWFEIDFSSLLYLNLVRDTVREIRRMNHENWLSWALAADPVDQTALHTAQVASEKKTKSKAKEQISEYTDSVKNWDKISDSNKSLSMRCPSCGYTEKFYIVATSEFSVTAEGVEPIGELNYEDSTVCRCPSCDHTGPVSCFRYRSYDVEIELQQRYTKTFLVQALNEEHAEKVVRTLISETDLQDDWHPDEPKIKILKVFEKVICGK